MLPKVTLIMIECMQRLLPQLISRRRRGTHPIEHVPVVELARDGVDVNVEVVAQEDADVGVLMVAGQSGGGGARGGVDVDVDGWMGGLVVCWMFRGEGFGR